VTARRWRLLSGRLLLGDSSAAVLLVLGGGPGVCCSAAAAALQLGLAAASGGGRWRQLPVATHCSSLCTIQPPRAKVHNLRYGWVIKTPRRSRALR